MTSPRWVPAACTEARSPCLRARRASGKPTSSRSEQKQRLSLNAQCQEHQKGCKVTREKLLIIIRTPRIMKIVKRLFRAALELRQSEIQNSTH